MIRHRVILCAACLLAGCVSQRMSVLAPPIRYQARAFIRALDDVQYDASLEITRLGTDGQWVWLINPHIGITTNTPSTILTREECPCKIGGLRRTADEETPPFNRAECMKWHNHLTGSVVFSIGQSNRMPIATVRYRFADRSGDISAGTTTTPLISPCENGLFGRVDARRIALG